ncbi:MULTISPECIES: hypothetical protein [unclassified Microcoleus]|uniref:hypothetical protein n=1 Tax=unclassified Microcoleus TaxID=2642155 RepID=UPI002FD018EB
MGEQKCNSLPASNPDRLQQSHFFYLKSQISKFGIRVGYSSGESRSPEPDRARVL